MLTAADLLQVWERGIALRPFQRALLLLQAAAAPEDGDLAELSIGQRDRRLLDLREALFGPELPCRTDCPACGEALELNLAVADLRLPATQPPDQPGHGYSLILDDCRLCFRLPNSHDLASLGTVADPDTARDCLLERCLTSAVQAQTPVSLAGLSSETKQAVAARMAEIDPQSQVELDLTCPSCGTAWQTLFDITAYLWSEIHTWATRLLRDVHTLAVAYGWRETDILAMSPLRRRIYLDMLGA